MQLFNTYSQKELLGVCKYFLSFVFLLPTGHTAVTEWAQLSVQNHSRNGPSVAETALTSPQGSTVATNTLTFSCYPQIQCEHFLKP